MTNVMTRRLQRSDFEPIESLLRAAGNFTEVEAATAGEMVRASLDEPNTTYKVLVAERDGRSLGYALFGQTAFTDGTWDLYWIAVHPDAHGNGIGKTLLLAVEDEVRRSGGRILVIETSGRADYEKARRLYERRGYTRAAQIVDFYREGDDKLI
jgi:ribosomal protein S18 acetylase RimI-like enzyme